MKQKAKIIKTVDINDEYSILIVKKIKETPKICKNCPHLHYFLDISRHYCDKYRGIVEPTDTCIEDGM